MCLQYSRGEVLPTGEERGQVIEALGEVMSKEGMLNVQALDETQEHVSLLSAQKVNSSSHFSNLMSRLTCLRLWRFSSSRPRLRGMVKIKTRQQPHCLKMPPRS
mmetsp:Transcript_34349/g.64044  ORF Transcript_34349/g.64044 Transcript_34349/m.64044 type:complete len:104 (+) Transcript_34349:227-538(+)